MRRLLVLVLLVSACAVPATETGQYQTFLREVEGLEAQRDGLAAQVAELEPLVVSIDSLDFPEDEKFAELSALQRRADRQEADTTAIVAAHEEVAAELLAAEEGIASTTATLDEEMFATPGFEEAVSDYVLASSRRDCAFSIGEGIAAELAMDVPLIDRLAPAVSDQLLDLGVPGVEPLDVDCTGWWLDDTEYWTRSEIVSILCSDFETLRVADTPKAYVLTCLHGYGRIDSTDRANCTAEVYADDSYKVYWKYRVRVKMTATADDCRWLTNRSWGSEFEWWAFVANVEDVWQHTGYFEMLDLRLFRP